VVRPVNISLVEVEVGEYVIVHAGFAIQVLDKKAADEALHVWNQLLSVESTLDNSPRTSETRVGENFEGDR